MDVENDLIMIQLPGQSDLINDLWFYVPDYEKIASSISMDTLSMGMTGDYEVAIEEGATIVRVGTGIFGERYYPNKG